MQTSYHVMIDYFVGTLMYTVCVPLSLFLFMSWKGTDRTLNIMPMMLVDSRGKFGGEPASSPGSL